MTDLRTRARRSSPIVRGALALAGVSLATACGGAAPPLAHVPVGTSCRTVTRWVGPEDPAQRAELDRWCVGVGAPELVQAARRPAPVDRLALVSWNTKVGTGDITRLLADLRSGG